MNLFGRNATNEAEETDEKKQKKKLWANSFPNKVSIQRVHCAVTSVFFLLKQYKKRDFILSHKKLETAINSLEEELFYLKNLCFKCYFRSAV